MQFPLDHPKYLKHNLPPRRWPAVLKAAGHSSEAQGRRQLSPDSPCNVLCPTPLAANAGLNSKVLQPEDMSISKTLLNPTEMLKEM